MNAWEVLADVRAEDCGLRGAGDCVGVDDGAVGGLGVFCAASGFLRSTIGAVGAVGFVFVGPVFPSDSVDVDAFARDRLLLVCGVLPLGAVGTFGWAGEEGTSLVSVEVFSAAAARSAF